MMLLSVCTHSLDPILPLSGSRPDGQSAQSCAPGVLWASQCTWLGARDVTELAATGSHICPSIWLMSRAFSPGVFGRRPPAAGCSGILAGR